MVLGLARSGRAAQAALERRGVEVRAADRTLGNDADLALLDGAGLLVKSPGVPGEAALVAAARERGIPVWSEIELGYRLLGARLVAVTGTNGKTTTSELLGAMLGAPVAGNVGAGADGARRRGRAGRARRLRGLVVPARGRPRVPAAVAVLLNLEPDHLDRHGSFEAYRDAKLRLFENQRPEDTAVVPRGFGPVPGAARRVEFRWDDPLPAEPLIPGQHNRENAAAATAAARAAGATEERIARGAARRSRACRTGSSRCASSHGVLFVNDSKATNVAAARRGVAAYDDRPLRLIVGGSRKGEDFAPLAAALGPNVRAVYAIGETAAELLAAIPTALGAHDLSHGRSARRGRRRAGRRRPALARLRELRPVPRLRGPRRRRSAGSSKRSTRPAPQRCLTP